MKKFPSDPYNYSPIQLFYLMRPDVKYVYTTRSICPSLFQVDCVIDGIPFVRLGNTFIKIKKMFYLLNIFLK